MTRRLYVGNFPFSTTEQDLRQLFGQVGDVSEVCIITDKETQRSRGFGFVEMAIDAEAQAAIARFNGTELGGRPLQVNEAREREKRNGESRDTRDRRPGRDRDRAERW